MKRKVLQYLTIQQFIFIVYFILTTVMFVLAIYQGSNGITFKLFGGGDDGYFYWIQAQNVADGNPWAKTSIYPLMLGTIFKIIGFKSVFVIRMVNYVGFLLLVFFSISMVKLQFKMDDVENSREYKYKAQTLLLISYLFYASLQMNINFSILRDVWIYALYILVTFLSSRIIFFKKNRVFNFVVLIFSIWLLKGFRGYAALSFLLAMFIYFAYMKIKVIKNSKRLFFFGVFAFAIYYTFFIDFSILGMSLKRALTYRASALDTFSGGSQMWISLDQPNFILFLFNYIHSYIGNLIGPLPWHVSGISTLLVFFIETIPMCLILKFLWKKRSTLTKLQAYILTHGFVWIGLIGVTNDNLGTASRLRAVAWLLILIVFVVVYSKEKYLSKLRRE